MSDTPKPNPESLASDRAQRGRPDVAESITSVEPAASAPRPNSREAEQIARFVTGESGPADDLFVDDLVAANRFKNFLIGRGVDVPADVINGLSELISAFNTDIERHHGKIPRIEPLTGRARKAAPLSPLAAGLDTPSRGD